MNSALAAIKAAFDLHFREWEIALPELDLPAAHIGAIHKAGWTIRCRLVDDAGEPALEYFASHRMTNDTLNRIDARGNHEVMGFCQEFYLAGDETAEREYEAHNRRFYQDVQERGLW